MVEFKLENDDFIELNKLLKIMQMAGSGGEANQMILAGLVKANGMVATQKRKKLRKGDVVQVQAQEIKIV
ncbi:MAG: RNA-binding S4 domain-containing protein [Bacteroidota bacterium]